MHGCHLTSWGSLCYSGPKESPILVSPARQLRRNQILWEKLSLFLTSDAYASLAENKEQG